MSTRREFIAGLAGAAAAWPVAARGQEPAVPVVGFLRSSRVEGFADLPEAVRAGLRESGYEVGRNVAIEYRWGDDQTDRLPALVDELIRKPVAVIVANGVAVSSIKAATTTVPVVFVTGTDPVRDGWVTSFNRPGGNLTGISFLSGETAGKRLELLRQLVPGVGAIGALVDPRTNEGVYRKLDSTIMVMKSAEDRHRCDAAYVLDGAMDRSVFAKRPMSPQLVIISGILRQDPA